MDYTNVNFTLNCESNPAIYKECSVQWMQGWSKKTMNKVSCRRKWGVFSVTYVRILLL